jgi:hypothetical protein
MVRQPHLAQLQQLSRQLTRQPAPISRVHNACAQYSSRVALVHERRVVWKGSARTSRTSRSFELMWTLPALPDTDGVTARVRAARSHCHATANLAED